ncbi:hypothetical protein DPMN_150016 [Dreissena polymorpha]|uniref:Uncharacterized protein n=1 Tax=Dreissena polymorpha TaxID=45954 RepID=A0A9D4FCN4_DREPO|nr:hypothetical protein DPMN_150016 [Dreissena polymorpha]
MILSRMMLKRMGESKKPCQTTTVVLTQFPMLLLNTGGFVIEVFDASGQVGLEVVQPHGSPQCCMPYPVKCLLRVNENAVEVLLVL